MDIPSGAGCPFFMDNWRSNGTAMAESVQDTQDSKSNKQVDKKQDIISYVLGDDLSYWRMIEE